MRAPATARPIARPTARTILLALLVVLLPVVAGCGGGGSTAAAPATATPTATASLTTASASRAPTPSVSVTPTTPAQIALARARTALASAGSVHLTGTIKDGTGTTALDLRVVGEEGGIGTVGLPQGPITILRIGSTSYLSAEQATWVKLSDGDAATGAKLAGKFIKISNNNASFAGFVQLTRLSSMSDSLLTPQSTLTVGSPTTVRGVKATTVVDGTSGGTVYIAASGPPRPLSIVSDGGATRLDFLDYGAPVSLPTPPPSQVLELPGF